MPHPQCSSCLRPTMAGSLPGQMSPHSGPGTDVESAVVLREAGAQGQVPGGTHLGSRAGAPSLRGERGRRRGSVLCPATRRAWAAEAARSGAKASPASSSIRPTTRLSRRRFCESPRPRVFYGNFTTRLGEARHFKQKPVFLTQAKQKATCVMLLSLPGPSDSSFFLSFSL